MGFFSDFFGGSQRRDLRRSKRASDAALSQGYEDAQSGYDQAFDMLSPYAERGKQGFDTYSQALGLGTPDQRDVAQSLYFDDPAFQRVTEDRSNRLLRQMNARGGAYTGKAALAGARVGVEGYNDWLNRMAGLGQQGAQFTGQQAAIRTGQGDLAYGYGATRAGNEVSFGNAMAQSRSTGINNLLSLGGTIARGASLLSDIRLKRDIERIGELASGLPVYQFRYLWSDQPHIGVMAHEAMAYAPEAVSEHDSGYLMVNYASL